MFTQINDTNKQYVHAPVPIMVLENCMSEKSASSSRSESTITTSGRSPTAKSGAERKDVMLLHTDCNNKAGIPWPWDGGNTKEGTDAGE
jgi:hypothetical protein